MDSIDLRTEEGRESLISLDKYKIDDPTEKSIYDYYAPYPEGKTTHVVDQLNRRLIWETDSNGLVKINFIIFFREGDIAGGYTISEYYRPEQLMTQFDLLGAIHSFYHSVITKELIDKVSDTDMKKTLFDKWQRGEVATVRNLLLDDDIKFTEIGQDLDKSFTIITS